jgi:hypothetical protein
MLYCLGSAGNPMESTMRAAFMSAQKGINANA